MRLHKGGRICYYRYMIKPKLYIETTVFNFAFAEVTDYEND